MSYQFREQREASSSLMNREMALVAVLVVLVQLLLNWVFAQRAAMAPEMPPVEPPAPGPQ